MDAKIAELHAAYCQATGFDLPLRMGRDRAWFDFEQAGFAKADLLLVVGWIRKQIPRNNGYERAALRDESSPFRPFRINHLRRVISEFRYHHAVTSI